MGSLTHIPTASCPRQQQQQPRFQLFFSFLLFSLPAPSSSFFCAATSPSRLCSPTRVILHRLVARSRSHACYLHTSCEHAALCSRCVAVRENWSQVDQLIALIRVHFSAFLHREVLALFLSGFSSLRIYRLLSTPDYWAQESSALAGERF